MPESLPNPTVPLLSPSRTPASKSHFPCYARVPSRSHRHLVMFQSYTCFKCNSRSLWPSCLPFPSAPCYPSVAHPSQKHITPVMPEPLHTPTTPLLGVSRTPALIVSISLLFYGRPPSPRICYPQNILFHPIFSLLQLKHQPTSSDTNNTCRTFTTVVDGQQVKISGSSLRDHDANIFHRLFNSRFSRAREPIVRTIRAWESSH